MTSAIGSAKIPVDFQKVRISAAQALRQYAQRHHQRGRWLLADAFNISVKTADGYLSGRDPIPVERLIQLPAILGFDFTSVLFDALERNGERDVLKRILHSHIQDIARNPHVASRCNLDSVGRLRNSGRGMWDSRLPQTT